VHTPSESPRKGPGDEFQTPNNSQIRWAPAPARQNRAHSEQPSQKTGHFPYRFANSLLNAVLPKGLRKAVANNWRLRTQAEPGVCSANQQDDTSRCTMEAHRRSEGADKATNVVGVADALESLSGKIDGMLRLEVGADAVGLAGG